LAFLFCSNTEAVNGSVGEPKSQVVANASFEVQATSLARESDAPTRTNVLLPICLLTKAAIHYSGKVLLSAFIYQ
jgi:hypothetical protein